MTIDNIHDLTFTTKQQYLEWRAEWRARYAKLSKDIRSTKGKIAQKFKDGEYADTLQGILINQRQIAFDMIETRIASKKRAGEQYTALLALAA